MEPKKNTSKRFSLLRLGNHKDEETRRRSWSPSLNSPTKPLPFGAKSDSSEAESSPIREQHATSMLVFNATHLARTLTSSSGGRRSEDNSDQNLQEPQIHSQSQPQPQSQSQNNQTNPTVDTNKRNSNSDQTELSPDADADADELVQLAIQYHEKNELEKATYYFKLAAEKGSPMGIFLYGISLRHGWGCKQNSVLAVHYLQKAAELAIEEMHTLFQSNPSIARHELIMAIYELGVSFRQGWGVPKKKSTAVYYFEIAANMGDPDAQNDLAHCYEHGDGIAKDRFKAALYYRLAEKQGRGLVGNSWIWKPKYDVVETEMQKIQRNYTMRRST
ncbi:uncharacterized protein VTP21DRAFT_1012 [Calcarisporiella thermophila]|uniref:uncharacterized protein n=1 Tax=Calcarisporiella thermophila TaxID=911321 RepID=UPI003742DD38